jgi:phosphoribosylamine--glycine ligase
MGTYSPSPLCDEKLLAIVRETVLLPVVRTLSEMGRPYRGLLYAGLMLTLDRGPMVLEFNCRFGDPETQAVLPRFGEDLLPWLLAAASDRLPARAPRIDPRAAVCVVQCSAGYPGPYQKGIEISGTEAAAALSDVHVFHAGTSRGSDGRLVTAGGRVLGVTALGETLALARERAYQGVSAITFAGEHHRTDIAARGAS